MTFWYPTIYGNWDPCCCEGDEELEPTNEEIAIDMAKHSNMEVGKEISMTEYGDFDPSLPEELQDLYPFYNPRADLNAIGFSDLRRTTNKTEDTKMPNNTINLSPEITQQLEYWKIEKAIEVKAIEDRRAREDWIVSQLGEMAMAAMSRTLHTTPGVDITYKQERVFNQVALTGMVARRPHLVGSLLKIEYKVDGRMLNSVLTTGQDVALKGEMEGTFTLKTHRTSFKEVK